MSKKRNDWLFRLKATAKKSSDCYFVTLTYDNEHLPGPGSNGKRVVQSFMKRFRKNNGLLNTNFKYYLISELGGKFGRLHYHAIFFNTGLKLQELWKALARDWQQGRTHAVYTNDNRLHYVAKAHLQNVAKPKPIFEQRFHPCTGHYYVKIKPVNYFFACSSKFLGIEFLTADMVKYLRDKGDFTVVSNGVTRQVPSYYLPKVYVEGEDAYIELKASRLNHTIDEYEDEQKTYMGYLAECHRAARRGGRPPCEPVSWQERKQRAERLKAMAKKYNFVEPPPEQWFPKKKVK